MEGRVVLSLSLGNIDDAHDDLHGYLTLALVLGNIEGDLYGRGVRIHLHQRIPVTDVLYQHDAVDVAGVVAYTEAVLAGRDGHYGPCQFRHP